MSHKMSNIQLEYLLPIEGNDVGLLLGAALGNDDGATVGLRLGRAPKNDVFMSLLRILY